MSLMKYNDFYGRLLINNESTREGSGIPGTGSLVNSGSKCFKSIGSFCKDRDIVIIRCMVWYRETHVNRYQNKQKINVEHF